MAAVAAGGDDGGGGWGPVPIIVNHCSLHTRARPLASWRFVRGVRLLEVTAPLNQSSLWADDTHIPTRERGG